MFRTLTTPRLTLRPLVAADEPWITEAVSMPEIYRNVASIAPAQTHEETLDYISRSRDTEEAGNSMNRLIELGDVRLGIVGIRRPNPDTPFELGYWLHPDHWGKGHMTEAAGEILSWAEANAVPRYIVSGYLADNEGSGAVLRKLGFLPCWRGKVMCRGRGEQVDHIYMSRMWD